jgi:hypothetical protein
LLEVSIIIADTSLACPEALLHTSIIIIVGVISMNIGSFSMVASPVAPAEISEGRKSNVGIVFE